MGYMAEAIRKRKSVRSYSSREIPGEDLERIEDLLTQNISGPFGVKLRFELLSLYNLDSADFRRLGTYGIIRGAKFFIAGIVKNEPKAMEDMGYCLEKIILEVTNMGLGTCWLGGTFRRKSFVSQLKLAEDESLPAVSPLGYPGERRTVKDKFIRFSAGSRLRKEWADLFYSNDFGTPLKRSETGDYSSVLEGVRLAPSASNKQPWRICKETASGNYHFYLERTKGYDRLTGKVDFQKIDMGIAMCHFELSAHELGITGEWVVRDPKLVAGDRIYIATWVPG